ncbi:MAG: HNH endonuclease [Bacteroidota bacterium]
MARRKSAREKLREYFLANLGKVVETSELAQVAGIHDYARRIRELRREEGLNILSHNDRADLKPGQYVLVDTKPIPAFGRGISYSQRARILARNGFTCQVCGAAAGDPDPLDPTKKVRLHVDHIVPLSEGGTNDDSNLRVTCSACNEGRSNLEVPVDQRTINLLGLIRRAPKNVQIEVYRFLKKKFETGSE